MADLYRSAGPGRSRADLLRALDCGDPDEVAAAWFDLASLERQAGNIDAAREAFENAVATEHPDYAAMALSNLAVLEATSGRHQQARSAFERVIATGHAEHAPQGLFNFALFEAGQGNIDRSRSLYRQAIASGHPTQARKALFNLANLEAREGRTEDACELLLQAMEPPFRGDTAWRAHRRLMEIDPARIDAARAIYLRAMAKAGSETAAQAQELLLDLDPGYRPPGTIKIGGQTFPTNALTGAEWVQASSPSQQRQLLGIRTGGSEMHIVSVDLGDPNDRQACSLLHQRFDLPLPGGTG